MTPDLQGLAGIQFRAVGVPCPIAETKDRCAPTRRPIPFRVAATIQDGQLSSLRRFHGATSKRPGFPEFQTGAVTDVMFRWFDGFSSACLRASGTTPRPIFFGKQHGGPAMDWRSGARCCRLLSRFGSPSGKPETKPFGGMAQLVARLHGMQKVRGSNPLTSTKDKRPQTLRLGPFAFSTRPAQLTARYPE